MARRLRHLRSKRVSWAGEAGKPGLDSACEASASTTMVQRNRCGAQSLMVGATLGAMHLHFDAARWIGRALSVDEDGGVIDDAGR